MKPECAITCTPDVFEGLDEARKRRRQQRHQEVRPSPGSVEELEKRVHLTAVSFNSSNHVLTVSGTSAGENIEVYRLTGVGIRVKSDGTQVGSTYDPNNVNRIDVNCVAGPDTVTIGRNTATGSGDTGVGKNTVIRGGDGNDSLSGGDVNDTIQGDAGDDELYGFDSDDTLYGGYGGQDYLEGGENNDLVYGGDAGIGGNDEVERDTLHGNNGNDTLYGEGGNDDLYGESGTDLLYGGYGGDLMDPGPDSDIAYGGDGNDTFTHSQSDGGNDLLDGGPGTDVAGDYDVLGDTILNFP